MADYYLHVELLVEEKNARKFEEVVNDPELLALFTPFNWQLAYGLKGRKARNVNRPAHGSRALALGAPETKNCVRYVNLWDVPDPPRIAKVMQNLTDNNLYEQANSIVVREIQNLVSAARLPSPGVGNKGTFIEVHRRFPVRNLGTYVYSSGILVPILESNGWTSCGAYQALTGPLNSVTEVWYTEAPFERITGTFYAMVANAGGLRGSGPGITQIWEELDTLPDQEWHDAMDSYFTPRA